MDVGCNTLTKDQLNLLRFNILYVFYAKEGKSFQWHYFLFFRPGQNTDAHIDAQITLK